MKKFFLFVAALLGMSAVFAQDLTYNVTVPAGTKACYIAGDMNNWSFTEMTKVDDTHYTITAGSGGYKYCSGPSWDYVEKDAQGEEISNRTYSENDVVASWKAVYDPETPTPPTPGGDQYYIKNNWNSSGWAWQEMTPNQDKSEWTYTGVYGGTGVNINTKADDAGAQWFEQANIQGTATVGAEVTFTYNVAARTVTAVSGDTPTPPAPGTNTYYLVGYINGVDYGISGDIDNMGDYNLTTGPVVITFTEKSYVQVKNQNKSIYGTAYVDATEPGSTVLSVGATDKVGLPANVEITFTLTENADGTVTLAYAWGGTPTPPTPPTPSENVYGITVNGTPILGTKNESPLDPSFEEWQVLEQSLVTGDLITLYNQNGGATWVVTLDEASVAGIELNVTGDAYIITQDGCYNFYIKLKFEADQLYVGSCGDTPTPPTPSENVYGITVNGTPILGTKNESPLDPSFEEWQVLEQSLVTGDLITLYNQNGGATWVVTLDEASVEGIELNATGDAYIITQDGCYNFYIKLKFEADQLYVGSCGDTPTPPTPGEEGFGIILGDGSTIKGWKNEGQVEFLEYMIEADLTTGATFQLYDFGNKAPWTEQNIDEASTKNVIINASNVYEVLADGHYTIYLKMYGPENNQVYIGYTEPTSIREATIKAAVKKMVVNGIFYIVKDNKAYTAHGF